MADQTAPATKTIPAGFLCTITQQPMNDPLYALCGHCFDKSTFCTNVIKCPKDQEIVQLGQCTPFPELKTKIAAHIASVVLPKEKKKTSFLDALKAGLDADQAAPVATAPATPTPSLPTEPTVTFSHRVNRAHTDDIHGLLSISDNAFVSGSKDNTLQMWKVDGTHIKNVSATRGGYTKWITALASLKDGRWASGDRTGRMTVWTKEGVPWSWFSYNPNQGEKGTYKCKDRNKQRINCIKPCTDAKNPNLIYVGVPKYLQIWDVQQRCIVQQYVAHKNDWVYCVEELGCGPDRLAVVIGSTLEVWDAFQEQKFTIFTEPPKTRFSNQRAHISATTLLDGGVRHLAGACFDGKIRVFDLDNARAPVQEFSEHTGRIWSVVDFKTHFASSADDRTIKIWDRRQSNSCLTIGDQPGRVSSLLKTSETTMVSASCPDNPHGTEKASLTFWDVRMPTAAVTGISTTTAQWLRR